MDTEANTPKTQEERDAAVNTYWENVKSSWLPGDYELEAWRSVIRSKGWEPCRLSPHQMRESLKGLTEWSEAQHDHTWQSIHRTNVFRWWLRAYEEGDSYTGPSFPVMPPLDQTIEQIEEEFLKGGATDHQLLPYQERSYGITWYRKAGQDDAPSYSYNEVVDLLKKLHGQAIVRVRERTFVEGGKAVTILMEPAYTTESGIRAARTKVFEWVRSLGAQEGRDYLKFYKTK